MKDPVRRDSILTVVGMILMILFFLFAVYRPGQNACIAAKAEIQSAEQIICNIPHLVAELERLKSQLKQRQNHLKQIERLIPSNPDVHTVIREVADLTQRSNLTLTRLEPIEPIERETIQIQPFHLSLSGKFRDICSFLNGIETCDRMCYIESVRMERKNGKEGEIVQCEIDFSVYSHRTEDMDSTENNASGKSTLADKV